jgi:manganese oxidase
MGDMMDMGKPRNSLFMGGGEGPFGSIFMGGMFTILKVRENLRSYDEDPGWYEHPPGTVASAVGDRQAGTTPSVLPGRPVPGLAAALADAAPLQAVKAGSCASMPPFGRR